MTGPRVILVLGGRRGKGAMGINADNCARTARGAAMREMAIVVGLALGGLILAVLVAFTPWRVPVTIAPDDHLPAVVGVVEPIDHGVTG